MHFCILKHNDCTHFTDEETEGTYPSPQPKSGADLGWSPGVGGSQHKASLPTFLNGTISVQVWSHPDFLWTWVKNKG